MRDEFHSSLEIWQQCNLNDIILKQTEKETMLRIYVSVLENFRKTCFKYGG